MTYKDMTFCAAKCLNHLCERNRIYTAKAGAEPICLVDFSPNCFEYESVDDLFLSEYHIENLMTKANMAEGLSWELGEAFHELSFKVADRLHELKTVPLSPKEKRGFEQLVKRLKLRQNMLPWQNQKRGEL